MSSTKRTFWVSFLNPISQLVFCLEDWKHLYYSPSLVIMKRQIKATWRFHLTQSEQTRSTKQTTKNAGEDMGEREPLWSYTTWTKSTSLESHRPPNKNLAPGRNNLFSSCSKMSNRIWKQCSFLPLPLVVCQRLKVKSYCWRHHVLGSQYLEDSIWI